MEMKRGIGKMARLWRVGGQPDNGFNLTLMKEAH
jgi:hypothetical protein